MHFTVTKLLGDTANPELKAASISDLKALCLALLDNLNDKTLALSHQKQTNRLFAAKIGTLEQKLRKVSGDSSDTALLTPSQLLLDNYTSARVDEELRVPKMRKDVPARNGESSGSSKSMLSSEFETQSISDMSSELKQLNYIKIIADDDELNEESFIKNFGSNFSSNESDNEEELEPLPPDVQKLVDEAMKSMETSESS